MKYDIIRTDTADKQLRDLLIYIAEDSGDADIPKSLTISDHLLAITPHTIVNELKSSQITKIKCVL